MHSFIYKSSKYLEKSNQNGERNKLTSYYCTVVSPTPKSLKVICQLYMYRVSVRGNIVNLHRSYLVSVKF